MKNTPTKLTKRLNQAYHLLGLLGHPLTDLDSVVEDYGNKLRDYAAVDNDRVITRDMMNERQLVGTVETRALINTFLFGSPPLDHYHLRLLATTLMTKAQEVDLILNKWFSAIILGSVQTMGLSAADMGTILTLITDPIITPMSNDQITPVPINAPLVMERAALTTDRDRTQAFDHIRTDEMRLNTPRLILGHVIREALLHKGDPTSISDHTLVDIGIQEILNNKEFNATAQARPHSFTGMKPQLGVPPNHQFQIPIYDEWYRGVSNQRHFQPNHYGEVSQGYGYVNNPDIDVRVHRTVCSVTDPAVGASILRPDVLSALRGFFIAMQRAGIDLDVVLSEPNQGE